MPTTLPTLPRRTPTPPTRPRTPPSRLLLRLTPRRPTRPRLTTPRSNRTVRGVVQGKPPDLRRLFLCARYSTCTSPSRAHATLASPGVGCVPATRLVAFDTHPKGVRP